MSIHYVNSRRIAHANVEVAVCTTNSQGVMGTGVAKVFREQVPKLYYRYRKHCDAHAPMEMVPYVFDRGEGRFVYCLHTKISWRNPSKFEYVEKGLQQFVAWCKEHNIKSVAITPLGCGNGGLTFTGGKHPEEDIKPLMERYLNQLDAKVYIYCP